MGTRRNGKSTKFESLETRRLMSTTASGTLTLAGTVSLPRVVTVIGDVVSVVHGSGDAVTAGDVKISVTSKGTLVVEGATFNDSIAVSTNKKSFTISVYGSPSIYFARNEIKRIRVEGGAGKDTLSFIGNHIDIPVSLLGGAGNDTISSSPGTTLIGGDGDDNLNAGGVRTIVSQNSNVGTNISAATLLPAHTVVYNSVGTTNSIILGSTDIDTGSLVEGGDGNDTITASAGPDTINGGRGTDAITRTIFNDTLIPITDDISPGDTVNSIEAYKVINANTGVVNIVNGTVTVHAGT